MTVAYMYVRFSTKRQEEGDSIRRQLDKAKHWCQMKGVTLSEQTFEDLGVSAFKEGGKRPALSDMLSCIKQGTIPVGSYVLLEDTDRLTRRGFKHALDLLYELVEHVYVVMLSSGMVYDKTNSAQLASALPLLLDADRGRMESERKSVLIKSAKKKIRDNNEVSGKLVFWMTKTSEGVELNGFAKVIRRMIDMRIQGFSCQKIAKVLNLEGELNMNGKPWGASTIIRSLNSRCIYGAKEYMEMKDGEMVTSKIAANVFPAVATQDEWEIVRTKASGKGKATRTSMFSGLLRCMKCGRHLMTRRAKHNGKMYSYHGCYGYTEGVCDVAVNIKQVEDVVKQFLRHLKYQRFVARNNTKAIDELEAMVSTLKETKAYLKHPAAIASWYEDMAAAEEKLAAAKVAQELAGKNADVNYITIVDEDDGKANLELKKVISKIDVLKLSKDRTRYKIVFKDKTTASCVAVHSNKHNSTFELTMVSDKRRWNVEDTREEWEMVDE